MDKFKRIAEAIRGKARINDHNGWVYVAGAIYDPLTNDVQAMEIIKTMKLCLCYEFDSKIWEAEFEDGMYIVEPHENANQAVINCAIRVIEAGWKRDR